MFELAQDSLNEESDGPAKSYQLDSTPQVGMRELVESSGDDSNSEGSSRAMKSKLHESAATKRLYKIQGALRSLSKYKTTLDYVSLRKFKLNVWSRKSAHMKKRLSNSAYLVGLAQGQIWH